MFRLSLKSLFTSGFGTRQIPDKLVFNLVWNRNIFKSFSSQEQITLGYLVLLLVTFYQVIEGEVLPVLFNVKFLMPINLLSKFLSHLKRITLDCCEFDSFLTQKHCCFPYPCISWTKHNFFFQFVWRMHHLHLTDCHSVRFPRLQNSNESLKGANEII